ncbi:MAG: O-antigen ligase family protein [Thermoleophilia bacterium]
MSEAVREVAAIAGAAGVCGLLLPLPWFRQEHQRAAALALTVAAWGFMLGSLLPDDATDSLDRIATVTGAGAVVIALAALVVGVRVVLWRPTVWFVLLAVSLPIRIPVTVGSEEANLLVPLYAVIVLGIVALAWGRARGRLPRAPEGPALLGVPLAAFVAVLLVSLLWSADPDQAAIKAACFYLPFTLLYVLVVAWWPRGRALATLTTITVAGGTVAALVGLYQYLTRELWWNETLQQANVYSRFFRVNGIFFDPNILGRYLAVGILAALALAWYRRRPAELAALAVAVAVMAGGLVVTFSRSSTLMLMVGLILLASRAVGPLRALLCGGAILVVLGGAAFATSGNVRDAATDSSRLEKVSEGRFDLMRGGLTIWRDNPVVGAGLGGFEKRFEETLTPVEQRRVRVVISHNAPITVLSENGVVGGALLVALLLGAGWAMVRGSSRQGMYGWARWTMAAAALGIVVHSLLYAALFEDPFTWVLAAAAVAVAAAAPRPDPAEDEPAGAGATQVMSTP